MAQFYGIRTDTAQHRPRRPWPLTGQKDGQKPAEQIRLTGQPRGWLRVARSLSLAHAGETAHLLVIRGAEGWSDPLSTKTMHTSNSKECPTNSFQKCNLLLTTAIRVHNFQSQMIRRDLRGRVSRTPPQPESRSPSPRLGRNDLNPGVPARRASPAGRSSRFFELISRLAISEILLCSPNQHPLVHI